jgi:alcohol dehydrogenase
VLNGIFRNPTTIYFGKDMEHRVGEEVARYTGRILLHYGEGSIKKTGLYDTVSSSLRAAGVRSLELGGVRPNPGADLVYRGIETCRNNNI